MAGEWAKAGGAQVGEIVFEAAGKVDLRQSQTLIPQQIVAGRGAVAITCDRNGLHTVRWAIKGRPWKKPVSGLIPADTIDGAGMRSDYQASIVYDNDRRCVEPSASFFSYEAKKPGRQLWFSSNEADAFRGAVAVAVGSDWKAAADAKEAATQPTAPGRTDDPTSSAADEFLGRAIAVQIGYKDPFMPPGQWRPKMPGEIEFSADAAHDREHLMSISVPEFGTHLVVPLSRVKAGVMPPDMDFVVVWHAVGFDGFTMGGDGLQEAVTLSGPGVAEVRNALAAFGVKLG